MNLLAVSHRFLQEPIESFEMCLRKLWTYIYNTYHYTTIEFFLKVQRMHRLHPPPQVKRIYSTPPTQRTESLCRD